MPTTDKAIRAYLNRLVSIPDYAKLEGVSVVQAHRRIKEGKAETELIGRRAFVVLPAAQPAPGAATPTAGPAR